MRLTFIVPPSGFQLDERVYPMLGVLRVAAAARSYAHRVEVLDLSGHVDLETDISRHITRTGPSFAYGITATMPQMPYAKRIADALRRWDPHAKIILGGAHVTMVNAAAKRGVARSQAMLDELGTVFDVVVAGDGERACREALETDAGLVDADRPGSLLFLSKEDLSEAPFPARDLIDLNSYHHFVDGVPATSVIAQLGCPFGCAFCGGRNSPTFRRVRVKPVDGIVSELVHLYERYGFRAFMFLDDELNVNRSYVDLLDAIAQAQKDLGVEWRLCGLLKSELFTEEQAEKMYAAGFRKLLVGFESGHPRILENMKKGATVEDNTRAVELAHRAGLKIKALMSLGHPGESSDTIAATKEWLMAVQPDEFDATVLTVYPGTPYHDDAVENMLGVWTFTAKSGDRVHAKSIDQFVDMPYYKGIPGSYQSFVWTDHLTSEQLVSERDALEREVREALCIPWPATAAEVNFEHSMGMA